MPDCKRTLAMAAIIVASAACTAQPVSTPSPTLTPTEGPPPTPLPTPTPEGTEDPDEGLIFDELTLTRMGGPGNETHTFTVLGNGALVIDGELLGSVAVETVHDLDAQLDAMGFFRLDSHYGPAQARRDTFRYEIFMSRQGMEASVSTVDGYVPPSLQRLIDTLQGLTPVDLPPPPTAASDAESPPAAGD